ncbi:hypothetical protein NM688_g8641 [Phlebia brevispora]|uniref:Uncharacterized protein n=1 Tax=Phlebia brevispora TaxID=194682 RepID=A0ACC1RPC1_9APHY|nr:hypothetical protein NM688_g8641 [Phlebia brevispora]
MIPALLRRPPGLRLVRLNNNIGLRTLMTLQDHKYTAHATARGQGRNGQVKSDDDVGLELRLAMPRSLGGKGDGHNPEQLFAMGYASCFLAALQLAAGQQGKTDMARNATVHTQVHIGKPNDMDGFGLEVEIQVEGVDDQSLIDAGHARNSPNRFIKNYDFNYPQTNSQFTVTSVVGHLLEQDFDEHYGWNACDPFALFDAPIVTRVKKENEGISRNLATEARRAQTLMIWTDCDREGENIGSEIVGVCRKAQRQIVVRRARFSAIIPQQIHNAAQHPVDLDMAQSNAVEARMALDLRIGAAFTRYQTNTLKARFKQLLEVISYGPCQFPTLGFVVSRYNQVKSFVPEQFWYIYLALSREDGSTGETEDTEFTWRRGHLFDFEPAFALFQNVLASPTATVTKVTNKSTKKWKPLPLTTVELQKAASRLLKISPKKALDIAEKLYQGGFLSYPRTETDRFDPQFDFMSLIGKQTDDPAWGQFATTLQNGGFNTPRRGKHDDKAHPPIHPTAHAGNLAGDEKRVYEYITRRFLACCSKDALGWETTVDVVYGGEEFYATGLMIQERNYLEVFPYDKWSDKELPHFEEGEAFVPSVCELREGQTTRPNLLTEADLVALMDKNGIGTDATIAQHIQTIIDRKYVIERMQGATKYLVPSTLGIGLVEGYNEIGFDRSLSRPELRREVCLYIYLHFWPTQLGGDVSIQTERQMVQICEGTKTKNEILAENVEKYKEMYIRTKQEFNRILTVRPSSHTMGRS